MKNNTSRNALLAMIALGALTLYILACTSFSPDDTKVLYPAFDDSGAIGMAVYDREARRSEMLLCPSPTPKRRKQPCGADSSCGRSGWRTGGTSWWPGRAGRAVEKA